MDNAEWHYVLSGKSEGPETEDRLLELLNSGKIDRKTPIWRRGADGWLPLEQALGLTTHPPPVPGIAPDVAAQTRDQFNQSLAPFSHGVSGYQDLAPHPWRRYFARLLDTAVNGAIMWFLVGTLIVSIDQDSYKAFLDYLGKPDSRYLNSMATFLLAIFPNALLIGFTGSSLGKLVFGIRVTELDGNALGFRKALRREFLVWVRGLGFAIPIVVLFTVLSAFSRLKNTKKTSWDEELQIRIGHRRESAGQTVLNFVGIILWLSVTAILLAMNNV